MKRYRFGKMFYPIVLVNQNNCYILERFGKYLRTVSSGLHFKIPFCDSVAYEYSLKEQVFHIDSQTAITKDNVKIKIDGVLYCKITDSYKASYNISDPIFALSLLAQTSMRSLIGKIDLDVTFKERNTLNAHIQEALDKASEKWGITCLRYEIKDIKPPEEIKRSMELQAEHERLKRSEILKSEGIMQSQINLAEGDKTAQIMRGEGEGMKITQQAKAIVESLQLIAKSLIDDSTQQAMKIKLTESYLEAMQQILSETQVIMLPEGEKQSFLSSIASAISVYKRIDQHFPHKTPEHNENIKKRIHKLEEFVQSPPTPISEPAKPERMFYDDMALYSTE
jgi:regulator of protease activity HflC (stomatin/prohibitin superfamily)